MHPPGVSRCSECDPPRPCLSKCSSGGGESSEDCRLWTVQRHRSVRVHSEYQTAYSMDGTRINHGQTVFREIRCVSVFTQVSYIYMMSCTPFQCAFVERLSYMHVCMYASCRNALSTPISFPLVLCPHCSWSYGVTVWEICSFGKCQSDDSAL